MTREFWFKIFAIAIAAVAMFTHPRLSLAQSATVPVAIWTRGDVSPEEERLGVILKYQRSVGFAKCEIVLKKDDSMVNRVEIRGSDGVLSSTKIFDKYTVHMEEEDGDILIVSIPTYSGKIETFSPASGSPPEKILHKDRGGDLFNQICVVEKTMQIGLPDVLDMWMSEIYGSKKNYKEKTQI